MDKLTYSTDTRSTVPGANLSLARGYLSATGSQNHGYFAGGANFPSRYSIIDKITYSTDTTALVPSALLTILRITMGSTGNSTSGYFGGGVNSSIPASYSTMDKVTYAADTAAAVPGAALSGTRYRLAASSAKANGLPPAIIV